MAQLKPPITPSDHVQAGDDSVVTLIEYGDYECPHCGAAQPVIKQILARYGDRLLFAYRHFPLVEIHPHAGPAAETAEFAGAQGLFWQMHEAIFAHQHRLSLPTLMALASGLNLSELALREALANGVYAPKVQADFMHGVRNGVNGTPTFFVDGTRHDEGVASLDAAVGRAILMAAA
jgi:protein-disulfide isomerase